MNILSNIDFENLVQYCIFPNSFIRNGKLPSQQKVLFEILCSYDHIDDNGHRKGWCDPSLDRVADQLGLSKRSTQVHLKRLIEAGMVTVVYRNNEVVKDEPRSSIYILNILPGLSSEDRECLAAARTIEIKHLISGLSTIRVQTTTGIHYIAKEEFDLEYLITGSRASETMTGDIADGEDIISREWERKISDQELAGKVRKSEFESASILYPDYGHGPGGPATDPEIGFGPNKHAERRNQRTGFNSEDPVERIYCGNYKGITGRDLANYFKSLYEAKYPGEELRIDKKDIGIMSSKLKNNNNIDILVEKIRFYFNNYHELFSSAEYPRPRIVYLSISWIINKLDTAYAMHNQTLNETKTATTEQKGKSEFIV